MTKPTQKTIKIDVADLKKSETKQLHINRQLHKRFKNFCNDNDRTLREVTEVAIKAIMKQPELV
jgi:hypothetical protein